MHRPLSLLLLAGLASACASSGSSIPAAGTRSPGPAIRGAGAVAGTDLVLSRSAMVSSVAVAAAPAQVWPVLAKVYADLGIPTNMVDQSNRLLGSNNQRVRRILGKGPGSYFSCPGPYGNAANRDDVYLNIRTQVIPEGSGSVVRTEAIAVSKSTTAANTVTDCTSNGELEKLIAERIQAGVTAG